ncbi:hypothetical protein ACFW6F_21915 [Streptomyces sp. NPDC058746]|uniref:hypothetical protein n=1 Tax=Streptomyces sp. NPDC058746 TaxID=3346622 RepID=UPI0036B28CF0
MAGKQNKRQEPGKSREEQERLRSGQDPAHPGTEQEGARGKSPEELKRSSQDQGKRDRGEDEMRGKER